MKKIKIFVGALLCMNLLTISGCDKVVHSAVVEEKDKTVVKTEENKEKETVQKTVTEQVQAPKTYQTTIQSDLRSAERTDQENSMKFTLTADAPIEVPDVDAICLKNELCYPCNTGKQRSYPSSVPVWGRRPIQSFFYSKENQ